MAGRRAGMRISFSNVRPGRLTAVSLTVVAAAAGGATLAIGASRGQGPPPEATMGSPIPPTPREPEPLALDGNQRSLGVLRDDGGTGSSVPATLRSVIRGVSIDGENPDLGRRAVRTTFGRDLYVVPAAHGHVCLELDNGSGACSSVREIRAGHFYETMFCVKGLDDGSYLLAGMLPDNARAPALHMADGTTQPLTVEHNVYALTVPYGRRATELTWSDDHGVHGTSMADSKPPEVHC